jgi:hypothetical protein
VGLLDLVHGRELVSANGRDDGILSDSWLLRTSLDL